MQLSIEHKESNINQTFEIDNKFFGVSPEDLIIHIGLDTYKLKTTKTDKELDIEKRLKVFGEQEFDSMANMFPTFGTVQNATEGKILIDAVNIELEKRISTSETTKDIYIECEEKDKLVRRVLESFAKHIAILRGVESYAKEAAQRITHPCFPIDYSNRFMTFLRHILNNEYKLIEDIARDYSRIFQDIDLDDRAKIGLIGLFGMLDEFTKYLGELTQSEKHIEIYEVFKVLSRKAEASLKAIKEFKAECLSDSRVDTHLHEDKFSDYIIKYTNTINTCITALTDLDKKHLTSNMDQLELRHYVDTIISNMYSTCDKLLLQYTLDPRTISKAEDAYILAYYTSIYASAEKDSSSTDTRYATMFRHIVNISLQQKALANKLEFPETIDKMKKYVEDEYTNILHK